jgi:hypothetical protein
VIYGPKNQQVNINSQSVVKGTHVDSGANKKNIAVLEKQLVALFT